MPQNATNTISSTSPVTTHVLLTVRFVFVLHIQLAEPKIAQSNVTCVIQQDVLGLEIAVDDVEAMKTLKRTQQLGCVEPGSIDVEALLFLQVVEKLSSVDKSKHEVELLGRLEGKLQRHDEGVVDLGQDGSLGECVSDFGPRDDMGLSDGLEGVYPTCILLSVCALEVARP